MVFRSNAGLLDRCSATRTCPKIIEHFGSAEVWALKLTPEWVGTDARADLGGMVPFARTQDEGQASGDPRLSLEERYGGHAGYVAAVRKAADRALAFGFLLREDADRLVREAEASRVLR